MKLPEIFDYDHYRPYLRDYFRARRRVTGRKGTSAFARAAGCVPGHVRNVVTGRRNLSADLVTAFANALSLASERADYLGLLVRAAHPLSPLEGVLTQGLIARARADHGRLQVSRPGVLPLSGEGPVTGLERATSERAGIHRADTWAHPLVRAFSACMGENPQRISEALGQALSPVQVAAALQVLRTTEPEWPLPPGAAVQSVHLDPADPQSVIRLNRLLGLARAANDRTPVDRLRIRGAVWSIPRSGFEELRAEVSAMEREARALFERLASEAAPGTPMEVYQIGIQVFPLSRPLVAAEPALG